MVRLAASYPPRSQGDEMRVVVRGSGIAVDQVLRNRIERRLGFAFGRYGPKVGRITVRLARRDDAVVTGVQDPYRCIVTLAMPAGTVKVEVSGDEPFEVAAQAIERAGRAIEREVDRQRAISRGWLGGRAGS